MSSLEVGLKVRDIAVFGLNTCSPDESIAEVRGRVARFDFDNVPVRAPSDNGVGPIIGVVELIRSFDGKSRVAECMNALQEPMLIAGTTSLVEVLPRIAERPYRLVLEGERVTGVVTPSDVVQLPVRLLVFTLLLHLEEVMRSLIRSTVGDETARRALQSNRREQLDRTLKKQRASGLNPLPLDATQFSDKATLLFDLRLIKDNLAHRQLFEAFYDLRNAVAHAHDYARDAASLEDFLGHIEQLQAWIEQLTEMIPPEDAAAVTS